MITNSQFRQLYVLPLGCVCGDMNVSEGNWFQLNQTLCSCTLSGFPAGSNHAIYYWDWNINLMGKICAKIQIEWDEIGIITER